MRNRLSLALGTLAFAALACNLGIPQATPTVAPTRTPTQQPTLLSTPTRAAFIATQRPTSSPTLTPTLTLSATATLTHTLGPTSSPTHTATTSPSVTPLPTIGPTDTPSATPSFSPTPPPSLTPVPATQAAATQAFAPLGERPTEASLATQDVTPTFVTAQPEQTTAALTPVLPTFTAQAFALTAFPTALPPPPTLPPLTIAITAPPVAVVPGSNPQLAFELSTIGGFSGTPLTMPGGTATFARSPLNPNQMALVDARGLLYIFRDFAAQDGARIISNPFSEFEPPSAELNQARVTQVSFSPDGRYIAFLIDTDGDPLGDNDSSNDGVWLIPTDPQTGEVLGGPIHLLTDCPPEAGCVIVNRPDAPYRYRSLRFEWSPSSDALLVTVDLPEEGRRGLILLTPATSAQTRPPVLRYDDAVWNAEGDQLVVSGRGPDGVAGVGVINPDGSLISFQTAASLGLTTLYGAAQTANGQRVILASAGPAGSPARLYNAEGRPLTADIGSAAPQQVRWSPDRSAVLVVTQEATGAQVYVAQVDGSVRVITGEMAGALAVEWRTSSQ